MSTPRHPSRQSPPRSRPSDRAEPSDDENEEEVRERASPPGEIVYAAIYREGDHEIHRTNRELAWSGFAAGLSMGFSSIAEALLQSHLPATTWAPAISKLGYSIGFLIVILGRQQLFTKNTLTVILPMLNRRDRTGIADVARLWGVVLVANLLGAFLFACLPAFTHALSPDVLTALQHIGRGELPVESFFAGMCRALLAGWLIALMIWLLPFAEAGRFWVILFLAYVVGLGQFPHIIASAMPAFYLVLIGDASLGEFCSRFLLPTLIGNAVGGVACVAALAHAELSDKAAAQSGGDEAKPPT